MPPAANCVGQPGASESPHDRGPSAIIARSPRVPINTATSVGSGGRSVADHDAAEGVDGGGMVAPAWSGHRWRVGVPPCALVAVAVRRSRATSRVLTSPPQYFTASRAASPSFSIISVRASPARRSASRTAWSRSRIATSTWMARV